MKKENFASAKKKATKKLNDFGGNSEAGGLPVVVGTVLTFDLSEVNNIEDYIQTGTFNGNKFAYIVSTEGYHVGQSQIARNGNGLNLKPSKKSEMMWEFLERVVDAPDQTLSVRISDILTKEFKDSLASYWMFDTSKVEEAEDEEEEEEEEEEEAPKPEPKKRNRK